MFVVPYLTVSVRQAGVARVEVGAADRNGRPGLIRSRRHREMEPARYEKPFERVPQLRLLAVELGGDPLLAQGRNALSDVGPAGPAVAEVDAPPVDSPLTALQTRSGPSGQLTSPISGCRDRETEVRDRALP